MSMASSSAGPRPSNSTPEHFELGSTWPAPTPRMARPCDTVVEGEEAFAVIKRVSIRQHVDVAQQACAVRDAGELPERRNRVPPRRAHGAGLPVRDGDVVAHGDVAEAALVAARAIAASSSAPASAPTPRRRCALGLDGQLYAVHELPGWDDGGHDSPSASPGPELEPVLVTLPGSGSGCQARRSLGSGRCVA